MPDGSDGGSAQPVLTTTQEATSSETTIPTHLSSLVPAFNPSETDLDQYAQKVEMLTEIWPSTKLNELATRLILSSSGAAFQKLQLQRKEILIGTTKGLQRLVEILGGHWGKVNLQRKYEVAERALFRCQQKSDESNDSFLARADILWTDLITQGMTLEELRAYVVLRGSSLSADDRKRVVIESDSAGTGKLSIDKVSQAVRMLGSTFFQDFTGQKRAKGKVYDAYALHTDEVEPEAETVYHTADEGLGEDDWLDALAAEGDEDAVLICDYEGTMQDVVQEDSELASAYNAYAEARKRLSDRFKNRGFWNGSGSSFKGKGRGQKGKGKGNSYKGNRKSLQQRILESHCRLCGKRGHWKAECPERARQGTSSTTANVPTMTAETVQGEATGFEILPLEFLNLPEIRSGTLDATCQHVEINMMEHYYKKTKYQYKRLGTKINEVRKVNNNHMTSPRSEASAKTSSTEGPVIATPDVAKESRQPATTELVNFVAHGTQGILDSGATKSVVGSALLPSLLEGLRPCVREQTRRCQCNITFRFGNQGTLDSQQALVIPIGRLGLKIAIVPGHTPLLLSNTMMRTLQSQVDTARHQLRSRFLDKPIQLQLTPKGLFLIDINDLALASAKTGPTAAETFVHDTIDHQIPETKENPPQAESRPFDSFSNRDVQNHKGQEVTPVSHHVTTHENQNTQESVPPADQDQVPSRDNAFGSTVDSHHEPCRPIVPSADVQPCHGSGRFPTSLDRPDEDRDCGLRTCPPGQDIRGCLESRAVMAQVVPQDLRTVSQDRTPQADHLLVHDDRTLGTGDGESASADSDASTTQEPTSSQGQELQCSGATAPGSSTKPAELRRGRSGILDSSSASLHAGGRHHGAPEPNGQCGECHHRDSRTPEARKPTVDLIASLEGLKSAGDIDHDDMQDSINFSTNIQGFQHKFQQLVEVISAELTEVQCLIGTPQGQPLHLFEVMCGHQSELTKQSNNMGFRGRRFGYEQGDLSTRAGRLDMFQVLCNRRPQNVWYSPTCGPWSAWSQFNEQRSLAAFDAIHQQREQHLYQLAIGIVLLRFQYSQGRHFHWEQPKRSIMFSTPLLRELYEVTYETKFDMCVVGGLCDPVSRMLIQKGMNVRTTSRTVYETFHGRNCTHNHEHQKLEGSTRYQGRPMARTEFSERYTRRFARQMARVLCKLSLRRESPKDFQQWSDAFAVEAKRSRVQPGISESPAKRVKLSAAQLLEPGQLPNKRRRLEGKTAGETNTPQEICDETIKLIMTHAPRVGRKVIHDSKVLEMMQRLLNDKKIICIEVCKGTERKIAPPKTLMPLEAPFRRTIAVRREDRKVLIEDEWESWENLPQCRLIQKFLPCFLNITVYAANHPKEPQQQPGIQADAVEQSSVSERPSMPIPQSEMAQSGTRFEVSLQPETQQEPLSSQLDVYSRTQGPRFRALPVEARQILIRMHKNLGHPSAQVLSQVLRQQGYSSELVKGVEDLKCSVCQKHQQPKLQRPSTIKSEMDFGDKVSMDGLTWTSKTGKNFHIYHFLDHGTNYQTAVVAPNRSTDRAMERFTTGWLSWAGPPNELITDSATEFIADEFKEHMKNFNIQCTTIPPGAHWQLGKVERHGDILQKMLSKYEEDHSVDTFQELQTALAHCTAAKNACSLRNGFAPEVLVFGKGLRVPGSLASDDMLPAHSAAIAENAHGIRFRQTLAMRESARKAFFEADNNMALRRAALRRSRPDRGQYSPGEWIMYWRKSEVKQGWNGPAKVIQQDGPHSIFCVHMGSMIRVAPEHVRPVSALEAQLLPADEQVRSIPERPNSEAIPSSSSITTMTNNPTDITVNPDPPTPIPNNPNTSDNDTIPNQTSTQTPNPDAGDSNTEQPDQEPSIPTPSHQSDSPAVTDGQQVPVPDLSDDDELVCDTLLCTDDDADVFSTHDMPIGWKFEVDVDLQHVNSPHLNQEEVVLLATSQKKQRTEVKLCQLSQDELAEFDKAKMSEVNNWLSTGTVCKALRSSLSPEQILRCRWIHTWKPLEDKQDQLKHGGRTRKAKSRLVVLGYLDPELESIRRDSPTLGRQSRMLILQLIASSHWTLQSFDIKAAFLQGRTQDNRKIGLEPVPELRAAMNLKSNEVCRLEKSAYGLIDAPYLWFKELDRNLRELSFVPTPFDPCVYVLYKPGQNKPSGILGVHVDDGLCGGDEFFQSKIDQLEAKFPFGSKKSQSFVFTGIELNQMSDKSITMSQEKYVSKIEPIHIKPERKYNPQETVTDDERLALRGIIGSLQYASVNTRPDLASRLSHLQSSINSATIDTLNTANKVLHEAKRHKTTKITIKPIDIENLRFLAFSDASFTSKKEPDSHTGMIIMATHADIAKQHTCPVSPISWGCKKIQKVVTSTLAAETASLSSTLDQLSWLRLFWGWLLQPSLPWQKSKQALDSLPATYAASTLKDPDMAVTDCKSLYDLVTRTAPPNCQEFRTQLQARAIKDLLSEGVNLHWVHSGAQVADALTKIMQSTFLRHTLEIGMYKLHDAQEILRERACDRNRVKWLQSDGQQNSEL